MTPLERTVYDLLAAVAEAGDTCPTNSGLAHQVGTNRERVGSAVRSLAAQGHIRSVYIANATCRRFVTITATGKSTAVTGSAHWLPCDKNTEPASAASAEAWPANCFAQHNIEPGDGTWRLLTPPTFVPRGDLP